jgi:hypothetical protein
VVAVLPFCAFVASAEVDLDDGIHGAGVDEGQARTNTFAEIAPCPRSLPAARRSRMQCRSWGGLDSKASVFFLGFHPAPKTNTALPHSRGAPLLYPISPAPIFSPLRLPQPRRARIREPACRRRHGKQQPARREAASAQRFFGLLATDRPLPASPCSASRPPSRRFRALKMVVSKTSTTTGRRRLRRRYPEANHVCVVRRTGVQKCTGSGRGAHSANGRDARS